MSPSGQLPVTLASAMCIKDAAGFIFPLASESNSLPPPPSGRREASGTVRTVAETMALPTVPRRQDLLYATDLAVLGFLRRSSPPKPAGEQREQQPEDQARTRTSLQRAGAAAAAGSTAEGCQQLPRCTQSPEKQVSRGFSLERRSPASLLLGGSFLAV